MTQASKRIQQEATAWALRARLGSLTPEQTSELQNWLTASSRHLGAYVRANAMHADIERITALGGGTTPDLAKPYGIVARLSSWLMRQGQRRAGLITAAAVVTILLGPASYFYLTRGDSYVSGIGELRQVGLNDGSIMLLNTSSRAVVKLRRDIRDIELTKGEALFEVAHDPKRPFMVHVGDLTVKAVGTAFSVRNDDARIDVIVSEGTVELIRPGSTVRVGANHHATVRRAQPAQIQTLERRETDRQLAWRTGRLEFDGQPLIEAVNEINRHNRRQILVTDPQLAQHPIVGSFSAIDSEAFARIAAATLNAQLMDDGTAIRIEPKGGDAPR
jgi:transmembrane sensor